MPPRAQAREAPISRVQIRTTPHAIRQPSICSRTANTIKPSTAFQKFLSDFPASSLADNAQYWLGEAYYVNQIYPDAESAFQRVVEKYPQSRKLADALLKIGYCRYELKQWDSAKTVLDAGGHAVCRIPQPGIWRSSAWTKWRPRNIDRRSTRQAQSDLRINEIFHSLQGEADGVGFPTVFVRLTGCPLRCQYCDTEYAFHAGDWLDLEAILEKVRAYGARHVCVTGGEPLAQPNCLMLLERTCATRVSRVAGDQRRHGCRPRSMRACRGSSTSRPRGPAKRRATGSTIFRAHPARPAEIRDLFAARTTSGARLICRSMDWPAALPDLVLAELLAALAHGLSRIGFWPIAFPCASSCSFTRFCGATFRANERPIRRAIVLLSGGLDSATVLAMATRTRFRVLCAQRALRPAPCARSSTRRDAWRRRWVPAIIGSWESTLAGIGGSALTDRALAVPESPDHRYSGHLCAGAQHACCCRSRWAGRRWSAPTIFSWGSMPSIIPDTRIAARHSSRLSSAWRDSPPRRASRARASKFRRRLIDMTKADIIRAGLDLGVDFGMTVSCYQADAEGRACGKCDSCRLRAAGFAAAIVPDPTRYAEFRYTVICCGTSAMMRACNRDGSSVGRARPF